MMIPPLLSRAKSAATLCGPGYKLQKAVVLPEGIGLDLRVATLLAYENDAGEKCVILDNSSGNMMDMDLRTWI